MVSVVRVELLFMMLVFLFSLQRLLSSFGYSEVVHSSPAIKSIMIVIGNMAKGTKFMFNTNEVTCIIYVI